MGRRKSKKKQTVTTVVCVELPELQSKMSTNDNRRLATSRLRLREQKTLDRRAEDLSWQIRFAQMKLHHWSDIDNLKWDPLENLRKIAQDGLADIG